ncbi:MAG: GTP cyclohydrolase I [Myxococcaceae bacterium]
MSTQLEPCFAELLSKIGEDPKRLGLERTPVLAARAFADLTRGYAVDPVAILKRDRCLAPKNYQGTIEIPNIPFMSLCEHTFLPFLGTVNISYEPRDYMAGAGAFSSMIDAYAKRLQLQEPLTAQIADLLFRVLEPKSVKVQIAAKHCCMNGQEMRTQVILHATIV